MLIVACVKVGQKEYTSEHVNKLFGMVRNNLAEGTKGSFVCFTDDAAGLDPDIQVQDVPAVPALAGWWAKLYMFSQSFGAENRVLYFDLDTVITGGLDSFIDLENCDFGIVRDFYRVDGLQSCVMTWRGDIGPSEIWEPWLAAEQPHVPGGDQAWIEDCVRAGRLKPTILQDVLPEQIYSYKVHCKHGLPKSANVVCFHGKPRPWDVDEEWVRLIWDEGKTLSTELKLVYNLERETVRDNIKKHSADINAHTWFTMQNEVDRGACAIVGGGPSLKNDVQLLQNLHSAGVQIFATNNSGTFLEQHGITPSALIVLDARASNADRKSTRLNFSHSQQSRMPSSA